MKKKMTQKEFYQLLLKTNYPVVYHSFRASGQEVVDTPYIVYLMLGSNNVGADNKVAFKVNRYRVELYTDKKDLEAESKLEKVLDDAFFFYDKEEVYIDSESMFQISYELDI